jgi:hypothetical protein
MKALHRKRLWWAAGCALAAFVIVSALVPARDLPTLWLNDKIEHGLAFLGLALWFAGLIERQSYPLLGLALLGLGGVIEIAQGAMGLGRTADWYDWYADLAGTGAGLMLGLIGLGAWATKLENWFGL